MNKPIQKPSISALLQILDKPALLSWANKQGLEGINIQDLRAKSMQDGLSLHRQIQNFHTKQIPMNEEKQHAGLLAFLQDKELVAVENAVEHECFVGRYDVRMKCGGREIIYDYKSSNKVYFEQRLQLVAYSMCEPCEGLAVVHIPQFRLAEIKIENREPYERIILALAKIYNARMEIGET